MEIEDIRSCVKCTTLKPTQEFSRRGDRVLGTCKSCHNEYNRRWQARNPGSSASSNRAYASAYPDKVRDIAANYRAKNKERVDQRSAAYYVLHREDLAPRRRACARAWAKANPNIVNAKVAKRKASKIKATPLWAEEFIINEAYELATLRTKVTGVKWQVDHIVPLCSKLVCGLHCEANMQLLTGAENLAKGNRCWPDMP